MKPRVVYPIVGLGIVNVVLRIVYSEFYVVLSNIRGALVVSIFSVKVVIGARVKTFATPLYFLQLLISSFFCDSIVLRIKSYYYPSGRENSTGCLYSSKDQS